MTPTLTDETVATTTGEEIQIFGHEIEGQSLITIEVMDGSWLGDFPAERSEELIALIRQAAATATRCGTVKKTNLVVA